MAIEKIFSAALLGLIVSSCGTTPKPQAPVSERLGWLHGPCLAIANPNLAPGTPIAVVVTGDPQTVRQTRITEQTQSPETCPALLPGRASNNKKPGIVFYKLDPSGIEATDMGVGIVAPESPAAVVNGFVQAELNRDGRRQAFSTCSASEGIKFAVWPEKAYQGTPLWSAYYYVDYELTPNCP